MIRLYYKWVIKMNNKGFTLIELLATITILAVVMGLAVVSYNGIFNKMDETYYKTMETNLLLAGDTYFNEHKDKLPSEGLVKVDMQELINGEYLTTPKSSKGNVCSKASVYVERKNNKYQYTACLKCEDYESKDNICRNN